MNPGIYEISETFPDGRVFTRRVIVPRPAPALPAYRTSAPIPSYIWVCAGIFCFLTIFFSLFS